MKTLIYFVFNADNQLSYFNWYGSVAGTSCPSMYLSGMLTGVMRIYTPLSHSLPFCLLSHSVMAYYFTWQSLALPLTLIIKHQPSTRTKNTTEGTKPRAVCVYETLNRLILDCTCFRPTCKQTWSDIGLRWVR